MTDGMDASIGLIIVALINAGVLIYLRKVEKNINSKVDRLLTASALAEGLAGEKRGREAAERAAALLITAAATEAAQLVLRQAARTAADKLKKD